MKGFQIPNKIQKKVYFLFSLLFLSLVLIALILISSIFKIWIEANKIYPVPFQIAQEAKMPIIKTDFVPIISSTGAIIMDADSKVVLYAKNPDLRSSTASTIKIMTALKNIATKSQKNKSNSKIKEQSNNDISPTWKQILEWLF